MKKSRRPTVVRVRTRFGPSLVRESVRRALLKVERDRMRGIFQPYEVEVALYFTALAFDLGPADAPGFFARHTLPIPQQEPDR